jgi:hypothetical protein
VQFDLNAREDPFGGRVVAYQPNAEIRIGSSRGSAKTAQGVVKAKQNSKTRKGNVNDIRTCNPDLPNSAGDD